LIGLDTNVLVRFFTRDDEAQARAARNFIEHEVSADAPGYVSLVTLAELAWVLRSRYKVTRPELIDTIEALLHEPSICVQDENAVWVALDFCEQPGITFSDALIAAVNRLHGCSHTVTFDDKATRIGGMTLLR